MNNVKGWRLGNRFWAPFNGTKPPKLKIRKYTRLIWNLCNQLIVVTQQTLKHVRSILVIKSHAKSIMGTIIIHLFSMFW